MTYIPTSIVLLLLVLGGTVGAQPPVLAPAPISAFAVGGPSGGVLLGDVNNDRDLDLVTRHQQERVIRLHLGDGRAGFETTRAPVALGFAPGEMSLGDVDGNKTLDLVVTATDRDVVDVWLGDGKGAFRHARGSPFSPTKRVYRYNKRSLHLVDLNEDGHLDVVTANRRGQYAFRVLLGDGHGRFATGPVLRVKPAQEGYTLAFGDVDGDGDVDAVTAVSSPDVGRLDVHLRDRGGTFRKTRDSLPLPATYRIEAIADLNSDRRPDLVLSHRRALVSLLLNRGRGRFAHAVGSPFRMSVRPFALALADLNRDGESDLIGATVDSVTVLLRAGNRFPPARRSSFRAGPGAFDVALGDLNGDGRPDVVASSFESNAVTVLLGR